MTNQLNFKINTECVSVPKMFSDNGLEDVRIKTNGFHYNYAFNINPKNNDLPIETVIVTSQFRKFIPDFPFHNFTVIESLISEIDTIHILSARNIYDIMFKHFENCKNVLLDLTYPHPLPNHELQGIQVDFGSLTYEMAEKLFDHIEHCGRTPC